MPASTPRPAGVKPVRSTGRTGCGPHHHGAHARTERHPVVHIIRASSGLGRLDPRREGPDYIQPQGMAADRGAPRSTSSTAGASSGSSSPSARVRCAPEKEKFIAFKFGDLTRTTRTPACEPMGSPPTATHCWWAEIDARHHRRAIVKRKSERDQGFCPPVASELDRARAAVDKALSSEAASAARISTRRSPWSPGTAPHGGGQERRCCGSANSWAAKSRAPSTPRTQELSFVPMRARSSPITRWAIDGNNVWNKTLMDDRQGTCS